MRHVFWLIHDHIAGRPGPDQEPWSLSELRGNGIRAVLSVNDGRQCSADAFAAEGITYACIPLSANAPPQQGDAEHCHEALPRAYDFAAAQLEQGRRVLVHCTAGKDRTGLFLAYYLMRTDGLSVGEALDEVRAVRPIALSADGWDVFGEAVLADPRLFQPREM